jgi:hypothetical protein
MGWFTNLYLVEVQQVDDRTIVETNVYDGNSGDIPYFTWGVDRRPKNYTAYAHNTLFSNVQLDLIDVYPQHDVYESTKPFLLDASFQPRRPDHAVLFHIVLYQSYVPMRNSEPFIQPCPASVYLNKNILTITYPVQGSAQLKFWITPLRPGDSLVDYDLTKITTPDAKVKRSAKLSFGVPGVAGAEFGAEY